jgi:glutamate-ammonia-ligase adenylyltransferase
MTTDDRQLTLTNDLPDSLAEGFENKWQGFQQAAEATGISISVFSEIMKSLKLVFAFSNFVAETCNRDPGILAGLIDSGDLTRRSSPDEYHQKLKRLLSGLDDEETLGRILRHCRRRELVRIAWRDLSGWADLPETVSDLSDFADACLEHTLNVLCDWQCSQYGVPTAADGWCQGIEFFFRYRLNFCLSQTRDDSRI